MPNVLVVGAIGYIGQALTTSLVRSGTHTIYGLARTPSKASLLASQEINPTLASIDSPSLPAAIKKHKINIVIDVSGAATESCSLLHLLITLGREHLNAAKGVKIPKLGFIYTSGTWVHGSSNEKVNDLMEVGTENAPTPPAKLSAWRPVLEQEILAAADVLNVMIVRPALVYGRASTIWTNSRPGLVHVDDVAAGLEAAVDRLEMISGTGIYPVFDLVSSQESMSEILNAAGRVLGCKGEVRLVGPGEDLFMDAMGTSFNGDSGRAKMILGWTPRKVRFVQEIGVFMRAWVAGKET
ncbi:hypothetical protein F5882DRAFT_473026 [Hyaloscypha sp. PMI_1271]|nr:hypothetical protein F5882DRAFT_473026 [Hyaloscypha sp. PMI_1271]